MRTGNRTQAQACRLGTCTKYYSHQRSVRHCLSGGHTFDYDRLHHDFQQGIDMSILQNVVAQSFVAVTIALQQTGPCCRRLQCIYMQA